MDREVVIVAINYRLGPIGFLSMGTEEVPGKLILIRLYEEKLIPIVWKNNYLSLYAISILQ